MKKAFGSIILLFFLNISAQQIAAVDFQKLHAEISPDPLLKEVRGAINLNFLIKTAVDSIYIDAKKMDFSNVRLNTNKARYQVTNEYLIIYDNFKKGREYAITCSYRAKPRKALYFIGWDTGGRKQIWTQGQGKDNSNWLPSFDDMNEKVEFDLQITFDSNYEVIANGKLKNKVKHELGTTWSYNMERPMSSYLVAFTIGKYAKETSVSNSRIPLEMYYYPDQKQRLEPTYRYSKLIFDFLEEEIGVPYPWQNYKQAPVQDFLYAGMENTSLTIFSDNYLTDSTAFIDRNYVNINAHELAHQWFGDLVTETHATHHWLHEGFATYYALLAEREVFGDDYYYHELFKTAKQLINAQETDTIPLLHPKASSLTFYQKGAWVLHMLREKVGDKAFKNSVKKYLNKFRFKNVSTLDFMAIVEQESGIKLSDFIATWLEKTSFPAKAAQQSLSKNTSVKLLYDFESQSFLGRTSRQPLLPKNYYYPVAQRVLREAIDTIAHPFSNDIIAQGFASDDLKIRQTLATHMQRIPPAYKARYETLLHDMSYRTVESALFNLWVNFPEQKAKYLDATNKQEGFRDKSLRSLWLTLALVTPGYNEARKAQYHDELISYTDPKYGFETRQHAFSLLLQIQAYNETAIKNLINGTGHHNWRFKKQCKELLEELKKNPTLQEWINQHEE